MKRALWFMLAALDILSASPAPADVPSAAASYVEPCLVACPAADTAFTVFVRKASGIALPGATVDLDLCGCPGLVMAPLDGTEGYSFPLGGHCRPRGIADVQGHVDLRLRIGGVCSAASIDVFADGVLLANRTALASFDQNGDLVVDLPARGAIDAKLGTGDPTADFDCDGQVTPADRTIAQGHLGHMAAGPTAVARRSWTSIKLIYR
jgi:hypothetical protein